MCLVVGVLLKNVKIKMDHPEGEIRSHIMLGAVVIRDPHKVEHVGTAISHTILAGHAVVYYYSRVRHHIRLQPGK